MSRGLLDGIGTKVHEKEMEAFVHKKEREQARRAATREVLNRMFRAEIAAEYDSDFNAGAAAEQAHQREMEKFKAFAAQDGFSAQLPATAEDVGAYLIDRWQHGNAPAIRAAKALDREHRRQGHPSPIHDVLIRSVMRGIRNKRKDEHRQHNEVFH
jgi:hypothetical protein